MLNGHYYTNPIEENQKNDVKEIGKIVLLL